MALAVLPFTVISILLGFVDMATGNASEHTRTNQKKAMLQLIGDRVGLIFAQSA